MKKKVHYFHCYITSLHFGLRSIKNILTNIHVPWHVNFGMYIRHVVVNYYCFICSFEAVFRKMFYLSMHFQISMHLKPDILGDWIGFGKILPVTFSLKFCLLLFHSNSACYFFTQTYCAVFICNAYLKLIEDEKESARLQKMSKRRGKMVAFEERASHSDSEVWNNMCTTHFDGSTLIFLFIYFVESKTNLFVKPVVKLCTKFTIDTNKLKNYWKVLSWRLILIDNKIKRKIISLTSERIIEKEPLYFLDIPLFQ